MKTAFISGITGQDGSYLADILLERGYQVHGLVRRSSTGNLRNIEHLIGKINIHYGDICDPISLDEIIGDVRFDEIYHEADQDNVDWSFTTPNQSIDVTIKGTSNLLQSIYRHPMIDGSPNEPRIFIPCSAMMFGDAPAPQDEDTPFNPQSPYAYAKVAVYHMARYFRQIHNMWITTGILYNHDSPRRHGNYLLHRICRSAVKKESIQLYDLKSKITVGDAKTFMTAVVDIMQLQKPDDFVIDNDCEYDIGTVASIAYGMMNLDHLRYVTEKNYPARPGNLQTLKGDMFKLSRRIKMYEPQPITPIIASLIDKYKKELS